MLKENSLPTYFYFISFLLSFFKGSLGIFFRERRTNLDTWTPHLGLIFEIERK